MLTRADLEAIRAEIANEPETSPARRLLAHIDEDYERRNKASRDSFRKKLINEDGHKPEDADKILEWVEAGKQLEFETVRCTRCFMGREQVQACMGFESQRCRRCHGHGTHLRHKVPVESRFDREVEPG